MKQISSPVLGLHPINIKTMDGQLSHFNDHLADFREPLPLWQPKFAN